VAPLSRLRAESFDLNQKAPRQAEPDPECLRTGSDRFCLAIPASPVTVNAPPFSYGEMIHVPPHA